MSVRLLDFLAGLSGALDLMSPEVVGHHKRVAYAAVRLIQHHANSNIRSEAIEIFRHTGANAAIVTALEAVRDGINNPVLKMKLSNSINRHMVGTPLELPEETPTP